MIIGAYAIGSSKGYIYVRNEYPLAVTNITRAIDKARESGLLGENILGSGFSFDVTINRGGGAFVCGESSALFASIEGRAGEPRQKYVHATDRGPLRQAHLPQQRRDLGERAAHHQQGRRLVRGRSARRTARARRYSPSSARSTTRASSRCRWGSRCGRSSSTSAAAFPRGGNSRRSRREARRAAASPSSFLDMPVDFDELAKVGSMMGSGGMIVMDDRSCMVDVAKYFLKFLEEESCGKCTPCREGVKQMRIILDRITEGKGEESDIEALEWIGAGVVDGSLCALGGSAPNPVLTHDQVFPRRVSRAYPRQEMPRGRLQAAHHLFGRRGQMHGLHRLRPGLPDEGGDRREEEGSCDRSRKHASSAAPATTPASSMRYR